MVGHAIDVLDLVRFREVSKLFGCKLQPVVGNKLLGKSYFASSDHKTAMGAVVEDIRMTSGHLECASTTMQNIFSRKGGQ